MSQVKADTKTQVIATYDGHPTFQCSTCAATIVSIPDLVSLRAIMIDIQDQRLSKTSSSASPLLVGMVVGSEYHALSAM